MLDTPSQSQTSGVYLHKSVTIYTGKRIFKPQNACVSGAVPEAAWGAYTADPLTGLRRGTS